MALLTLNRVSKSYTDGTETPALHDISLSVAAGEFLAIMGPSGSGKSSLLHILGLLDAQTSGGYTFNGKETTLYTPEEVARIRNEEMGFVFQSFNLLARESVLHNVMLPLLYSTVPEKEWRVRAEKAILSVGLAHRINHEAGKLSGGEKQRAAIARALVNSPRIIFADEPTGNLDSKSGGAVMEILTNLNEKSGQTIILVTHETYTAEHAGRIIRLKDGRIESDEKITARRKTADGFLK